MGTEYEIFEANVKADRSSGKQTENNMKPSEPPKQDYIHVRARRGQATDSHSLAERVNLLLTFSLKFRFLYKTSFE